MEGKWACILCGGRGSRLGSITDEIPKPLVKVHGKPIIWYSFLTLYSHGFRNFIFPTGYKGEMIKEYLVGEFGDMEDCELFIHDTMEATGISQRLFMIKHLIPEHEDFFLINSDTIFDFNVEAMYQKHKRMKALVTLSSVEVVSTWGLIHMRDGEIVGFDRERKIRYVSSESDPKLQCFINSGLAFLNKDALDYVNLDSHINFENVLYQILIAAGRAAHFELRGVWFPIDTPKDLDMINMVGGGVNEVGHVTRVVKEGLERG
jgi:glucose-1-phosphate cytidylyltransferase